MQNHFSSSPRLEAVIFDWAGTLVDFGSFAPTQIFVEAFSQFGLTVSLEQARGPMGVGKWDHIRSLCDLPEIAEQYENAFGRLPADDDVTAIYERFLPLQLETVARHSAPIPGAAEALADARGRGLKVGSCSGYPRAVMDRVIDAAAGHGIHPDCVIASDEVPRARPAPGMALLNAVQLGIDDVAGCVKVDDTAPGIEEGCRAGMWTVGLLLSGNAAGITLDEFQQLPADQLEAARERARAELLPTRPHFLVDSVADLPGVLDQIADRLAQGQRP